MIWGIVNISVGALFLVLAFRPHWISQDLARQLSSTPHRIRFYKWGGIIAIGLGAIQLLGIF